jgi:hypothetical protein
MIYVQKQKANQCGMNVQQMNNKKRGVDYPETNWPTTFREKDKTYPRATYILPHFLLLDVTLVWRSLDLNPTQYTSSYELVQNRNNFIGK